MSFPSIVGIHAEESVRLEPGDSETLLIANDDTDSTHVYLTPEACRALSAQLLKAARWAEGDRT